MDPATLQAPLPKPLPPFPPLDTILNPYHTPTKPGYIDRHPFELPNQLGWARLCLLTMVSYLGSNAFRPKANGELSEGEVHNTITEAWEEPDMEEEQQLGYQRGDPDPPGVTAHQRAIRLGRALDGNTMRLLGAFMLLGGPSSSFVE